MAWRFPLRGYSLDSPALLAPLQSSTGLTVRSCSPRFRSSRRISAFSPQDHVVLPHPRWWLGPLARVAPPCGLACPVRPSLPAFKLAQHGSPKSRRDCTPPVSFSARFTTRPALQLRWRLRLRGPRWLRGSAKRELEWLVAWSARFSLARFNEGLARCGNVLLAPSENHSRSPRGPGSPPRILDSTQTRSGGVRFLDCGVCSSNYLPAPRVRFHLAPRRTLGNRLW